MKTRTVTLISVTLLAILLIGAIAIATLGGAKTLKLKVKFVPRQYGWGFPMQNPWNAVIHFVPLPPAGTSVDQINCSTILLEGIHSPSGTCTPDESGVKLIVPFNGYDVVAAIWSKIGHMSPGQNFTISLEITGALYNEDAFSGTGKIEYIVNELPPP